MTKNASHAKSAHHVKSVHHVPLVKNAHRARLAKIASHVASVKNEFVNCVNRSTLPLRLLLRLLLLLKSVQLVSHVKNVRHALRVKNVNRVPSKPLPLLPKKS